jgi:hypothetical protein
MPGIQDKNLESQRRSSDKKVRQRKPPCDEHRGDLWSWMEWLELSRVYFWLICVWRIKLVWMYRGMYAQFQYDLESRIMYVVGVVNESSFNRPQHLKISIELIA